MKSPVILALAAGLLTACFVEIDEGPNRACDEAHLCGRNRFCVENRCVDALPDDAGSGDAGSGDGGLDGGVDGGADAGVCLARGARPNLISNASFEDGGAGWQAYRDATLSMTSHAYDGRQAARLRTNTTPPKDLYGINDDQGERWVMVEQPGQRLCFSAWVSANGDFAVTYTAREYDRNAVRHAASEVTIIAPSDGGWSQLRATIVTQVDAGQVDLHVYANDGGYFDVDLLEAWRE